MTSVDDEVTKSASGHLYNTISGLVLTAFIITPEVKGFIILSEEGDFLENCLRTVLKIPDLDWDLPLS